MKKVIFLLLIVSFNSCKSQKNRVREEEIIPKVENSFEKFDIVDFEANMDSVRRRRTFVKDEIRIEEGYQSPGFVRIMHDQNSNFYSFKLFYQNGNIKEKGVVFNDGSKFGTWYYFEEDGKFLNEENTDFGYDFGWNDILDYCEENRIVLDKGYPTRGGIKTSIFQETQESVKVWVLTYYDSDNDEHLEVTLDGKSGKELKRREIQNEGN